MVYCLSIRQPWVELVLQGRKTIEVRTWSTTHRGTLWLQAGKQIDEDACIVHGISAKGLPTMALVGRVTLMDCFPFDEASWVALEQAHLNLRPFSPRFIGWKLEKPVRIDPRKLQGQLGLMKLPDTLVSEVLEVGDGAK